jgi:hypothetical protein
MWFIFFSMSKCSLGWREQLDRLLDTAVVEKFLGMIDRFYRYTGRFGFSPEGNPSGGNLYRGLYNITLKVDILFFGFWYAAYKYNFVVIEECGCGDEKSAGCCVRACH